MKTTIHGLTYSWDSYEALAAFFTERAKRSSEAAVRATTQKAARFDEGQAAAYAFVAEFMLHVETEETE